MLAMLNHSWGIKINNNNNIIRVTIEIKKVEVLKIIAFITLNLTFSFFSLEIVPTIKDNKELTNKLVVQVKLNANNDLLV